MYQNILCARLPQYVFFAIAALTLQFPNDFFASAYSRQLAETYADRAWQLLVPLCFGSPDNISLAMVQAITLLAIYDFTGLSRFLFECPH